jgi:hypothetical protein
MPGTTRARNRTHGPGNPPLIQLSLEGLLCVFVSLLQGARTTLRMLFNRSHRDWDRESTPKDRPQATSGNHLPESSPTHRVILGLVPRIPVGPSRGHGIDHLETHNRDFRHNAGNDPVDAARSRMESDLLVGVPRAGGGPVLREAQTRAHRSALTRADQAPACAGDTAVGEALRFAAPAISGPHTLRFAP